jgi:glycosyltransferase involved in cell wall biosynthesis
MRILNVTQSYFPFEEFGGPPVKVRALSEQMTKRKHDVTVLTVDWGIKNSKGREGSTRANFRAEPSAFGWKKVENGIEANYLRSWLHYRTLSWNPGVKGFCRARLWKFDVVHIFGLYDLLGPMVAGGCQRNGTPYIVEPMGMTIPIVRNLRLKRLYHRLLGETMLKGASAIVATSAQEAAEMKSAGVREDGIFLRRNGVEAPDKVPERGRFRAAAGIPQEAKLVLYLGRLSEKKSPDLLLRAFARLAKEQSKTDVRLVIAGPDERGMRAKLAALAGELGVSSLIGFCGPLYGEAKWGAYRDADVFVLPSQNENYGNAAGEAVLAGTPVILTDRCGIAPMLGTAALVVRHDVEELREAVSRVLFEPSVQAWLRAGCREATEKLDWDEPAREMERLYQRLAKDQRKVVAAVS